MITKDNKVNVMAAYLKSFSPELYDNRLTKTKEGVNSFEPASDENRTYRILYGNKTKDILFIEYFDERYSSVRWEITADFELVYNFFGEKDFEYFIENYYKVKITKRNDFDYNWLFESI